jgi:2,4-dienoyl-CoA reductase-like NADH-dependent reductase (Old Yellow Enzyme family)
MDSDVIFQPLHFRNLTVKNRLFRSSISGRWDNYDGSGNQARINWEEKFARGGIGAIISSFVPVHRRGRILPNYAMIDNDDKIPFWRKVGEKVHEYDCRFIMQLSHSGRQRDVPGVENLMNKGLSSTSKNDTFHGLLCEAATPAEIQKLVYYFAQGARRAREAGLDGVGVPATHPDH